MKKIIFIITTLFVLAFGIIGCEKINTKNEIQNLTDTTFLVSSKGGNFTGGGQYPYNMNLYPVITTVTATVNNGILTGTVDGYHANSKGKIIKLKYQIDYITVDSLVGSNITLPKTWVRSGITSGSHNFQVLAYDNFGSMGGGSANFVIP